MRTLPRDIADESGVLFDDATMEAIDPEAHAAFVIQRVLDRGTMRSVAALVRAYGDDRIRTFLREGGLHRLSRRTAPLWRTYFKLTEKECTPKSSRRISSAFWNE